MKFLKLIQFIFFLALVSQSFGQESQVDSLKAILETLEEDTSKVNTLITICQQEYNEFPVNAVRYGHEALDLSEKLNYGKGIALANKYIGMGYYFQGEYWDAILRWQQSLSDYEAINDMVGVSNMLNNIGAIYWVESDDAKALDSYIGSLQAAVETTDTF
jgi:tetratricopeptide (TPR) repeat protein